MYNPKFSEFKTKFLKDSNVFSLMEQLSNEFKRGFKEEIIDQLDEEEVYEGIEMYYDCVRDDMNPEEITIFEILLFNR